MSTKINAPKGRAIEGKVDGCILQSRCIPLYKAWERCTGLLGTCCVVGSEVKAKGMGWKVQGR